MTVVTSKRQTGVPINHCYCHWIRVKQDNSQQEVRINEIIERKYLAKQCRNQFED